MNNIDYKHSIPESFQSRLIQIAMCLFGMKHKTERKMISNGFAKEPAKIRDSLFKRFNIQEAEQDTRKIWTISPVDGKSDLIILYFHGGAYMSSIIQGHWSLMEKLISKSGATTVVPDYPLAPETSCKETYDFIEDLFTRLITEYPDKRIVFMGDSAGGGLALGFTQQLRDENKKQPEQIIIFSPWLDVTMSNPLLQILDKEDNMLSIDGLKNAGRKYAAELDLKDFRVSPVYGDLTGLCRISLFTGTRDILNADAQKFKQRMKEQKIYFNYFEYPDMFHDWVIITSLKESLDVINKVDKLVNDYL
ncbi:MAG: alpha/beta hydrolase fold domain-containing protein [Bacteroidales bacterium]|nr:alpha/beta hydrolase fold domain-containing protein [Bacteroidales bacterium]